MITVAQFKEHLNQFPDDAIMYEWIGGSRDGITRHLRPKRLVLKGKSLYFVFPGAHMPDAMYDSADKIFEPEL